MHGVCVRISLITHTQTRLWLRQACTPHPPHTHHTRTYACGCVRLAPPPLPSPPHPPTLTDTCLLPASGLHEVLIDCSGGEEVSLETGTLRKLEALDKALLQHAASRVLVFCNKIETCREVENHLKRVDRMAKKCAGCTRGGACLPASHPPPSPSITSSTQPRHHTLHPA